jgi:predicted signal transduction protein with EAL and GGDEF domain
LQIGSSTSWQFFQDDLINDIQNHATGDYDLYRRADRLRVWVSNNVNAMTLDVSGNLIAAGTVHGTNITTMTATIDELRALVQGLQTRLEALEAAPRASHT